MLGSLTVLAIALSSRHLRGGVRDPQPRWTANVAHGWIVGPIGANGLVAVKSEANLEFYDVSNGTSRGSTPLGHDSVSAVTPNGDGFIWLSYNSEKASAVSMNTWKPSTGVSRRALFQLAENDWFADGGLRKDGNEAFVRTHSGIWTWKSGEAKFNALREAPRTRQFGYVGVQFAKVDRRRLVTSDTTDPMFSKKSADVDMEPILAEATFAPWSYNLASNSMLLTVCPLRIYSFNSRSIVQRPISDSMVTGLPTQSTSSTLRPVFGIGFWTLPIQGYTSEANLIDIVNSRTGNQLANFEFTGPYVGSFQIDPDGLGMVAVVGEKLEYIAFDRTN